jgi:hypothetical protein
MGMRAAPRRIRHDCIRQTDRTGLTLEAKEPGARRIARSRALVSAGNIAKIATLPLIPLAISGWQSWQCRVGNLGNLGPSGGAIAKCSMWNVGGR